MILAVSAKCVLYRPPQKIPRPNGLGIMVEHSPQHSNPNRLFQILRKIPRTTENTVNLHGSGALVNLIKYKIFDFIRHTVHGASPIHFRGLPTACWSQPPAVLPW